MNLLKYLLNIIYLNWEKKMKFNQTNKNFYN